MLISCQMSCFKIRQFFDIVFEKGARHTSRVDAYLWAYSSINSGLLFGLK